MTNVNVLQTNELLRVFRGAFVPYFCPSPNDAGVAKLVDAPDLGSGAVRRGGSSPFTRTDSKTPGREARGFFLPGRSSLQAGYEKAPRCAATG